MTQSHRDPSLSKIYLRRVDLVRLIGIVAEFAPEERSILVKLGDALARINDRLGEPVSNTQ